MVYENYFDLEFGFKVEFEFEFLILIWSLEAL